MLEVGTKAPDFTLKDQNGEKHSLRHYKGCKVVLYFYPRDNTPGCTTEALGFKKDFEKYKEKKIIILGVSSNTIDSHKRFAKKNNLPFTLLSDLNKDVIKKYDAWGQKKMYGSIFMGISRITYIIDEKGTIWKTFPKVKPTEHSKEILGYL